MANDFVAPVISTPITTTTVPKAKPKQKAKTNATTSTTSSTTSTTVPGNKANKPKAKKTEKSKSSNSEFTDTNTGLIMYPAADFYNKILTGSPVFAQSLGSDAAIVQGVVNQLGGQMVPTGLMQNPAALDYIVNMNNQLLDAARKAGAKDPGKIRDAIMDMTFAGIKNFQWRDLYSQPKTPEYKTAYGLLNQFWRDVKSVGLEKFNRSAYGKGIDTSGYKGISAVINGLQTYANAQADASTKSNAQNYIDNLLDTWGLPQLKGPISDMIWKQGVVKSADLAQQIRATDAYKTRFRGMIDHNKKYPYQMNEGTFLSTENTMMQVAEQYLPQGYFTLDKANELIGKGVSATEFQNRIVKGYSAAAAADPVTRKYLEAQGVDLKALAAYFLDPTNAEPFLQKQVAKATLRGYAESAGLTDFTKQMADQMAEQVRSAASNPYGTFTMDQARKAIDYASQGQGLTGAAPGSNAPTVNTTQLIGSQVAGFQGTNQAEAGQAVKQATEAAAAPFQAGGGYEATSKGVTGLGSAPQ